MILENVTSDNTSDIDSFQFQSGVIWRTLFWNKLHGEDAEKKLVPWETFFQNQMICKIIQFSKNQRDQNHYS